MFVNRQAELEQLDQLYERGTAQFAVVYGRRRIGKTSLINNWIDSRRIEDVVYWVAYRSS